MIVRQPHDNRASVIKLDWTSCATSSTKLRHRSPSANGPRSPRSPYVLHGVGDDPLHDVDTLDNAIQPLIASIGRVALRLDNDPISDALFEITVQSQAIRQALRTHLAGETTEPEQQASTAAEALTNAHAKFLQLGRQVVGPSEQAIADARKRHRLRPPA